MSRSAGRSSAMTENPIRAAVLATAHAREVASGLRNEGPASRCSRGSDSVTRLSEASEAAKGVISRERDAGVHPDIGHRAEQNDTPQCLGIQIGRCIVRDAPLMRRLTAFVAWDVLTLSTQNERMHLQRCGQRKCGLGPRVAAKSLIQLLCTGSELWQHIYKYIHTTMCWLSKLKY